MWMLTLLVLFPIRDTSGFDAAAEFSHARSLFLRGYLEKSQREAEHGYVRFSSSNPEWASKFRLLAAESMLWRGFYEDTLRMLSLNTLPTREQDDAIRQLTLEGIALAKLERFAPANVQLSEAEAICAKHDQPSCGEVPRAWGVLAMEQEQFDKARQIFLQSLKIARQRHDRWLEATALLNVGVASLQLEHFDESADWSRAAYSAAINLGGEDLAQAASGNLGWDYFQLGDAERSLQYFLEAERNASRLGDTLFQIRWIANTGFVYQNDGNLAEASKSYARELELARQIHSNNDIITSLEDLAHISILNGKLDEASSYIDQVNPLIAAAGSHLDALDVMLAQGDIAAARRQDAQAETIFRTVEQDPVAQTSMKLGAEHKMASLYERQGKTAQADRMYLTALTTFESARNQLKNEDSKLPFLANATGIYDDYIHFLVSQNRATEALHVADQSRAQTLAQGLGIHSTKRLFDSSAFRPSEIARKTGATLLFYWLGEKQSYLWVVTPQKVLLHPLPPQREIGASVERYRKSLLGIRDPLESSDPDGLNLYQALIAPARAEIGSHSNIIVLSDGALSQLNFETLIVPAPNPHYWIEDATISSASSLHLLASTNTTETSGRKLLLIGDAVSPDPDYPELPMAKAEMQEIQQHFGTQNEISYSRQQATAPAYLGGNPQQFAYIHFVAHGVASRTDPLDSAIILSRSTAAEDSFKLHARDIIQHPIRARLVTISACYGSGTRSYAGEGLVGLAWAFLRAGAHNVIGALWEVSDDSTPQLMGDLYAGLQQGLPPSVALHQAKLALLHSNKQFRKPFYWASLQVYTGL